MVLLLVLALLSPPAAAPDSARHVRAIGADSVSAAPDTAAEAAPDTLARATGTAAAPMAPPDTSLRVTGTRLRFGYDAEQAQRFGDFVVTKSTLAQAHEVARQGNARWFGIDSKATLFFRRGRLTRAHFEITRPSPRDVGYVEDQMRSMGYKRDCTREEPEMTKCTWTGATHVHLDITLTKLQATIAPAPPKPRPVAKPVAKPAPPAEPPLVPEVLVYGRPGEPPNYAPPVADRTATPVYPQAARKAGVQGNVWVRALVDTSGDVMDASVTKSIPELDDAALIAVRGWHFRRYLLDGQPARVRVDIPVKFVLH